MHNRSAPAFRVLNERLRYLIPHGLSRSVPISQRTSHFPPCPMQKPVTAEDVQKVHILIEHCLRRNMTKTETLCALEQWGIHPLLGKLVWECLEKENEDFFLAYNCAAEADDFLSGIADIEDEDLLQECRLD